MSAQLPARDNFARRCERCRRVARSVLRRARFIARRCKGAALRGTCCRCGGAQPDSNNFAGRYGETLSGGCEGATTRRQPDSNNPAGARYDAAWPAVI